MAIIYTYQLTQCSLIYINIIMQQWGVTPKEKWQNLGWLLAGNISKINDLLVCVRSVKSQVNPGLFVFIKELEYGFAEFASLIDFLPHSLIQPVHYNLQHNITRDITLAILYNPFSRGQSICILMGQVYYLTLPATPPYQYFPITCSYHVPHHMFISRSGIQYKLHYRCTDF